MQYLHENDIMHRDLKVAWVCKLVTRGTPNFLHSAMDIVSQYNGAQGQATFHYTSSGIGLWYCAAVLR